MGNKSDPVKEKFSTALWDAGGARQTRPLHPGRHPVRQPLARHRVGEVRHRPASWSPSTTRRSDKDGLSLYADGINVHAFLMPRAEFRKTVEGAIRNSFSHSLLAKGRLLYTHDETIAALCEQLRAIGERDTAAAAPLRRPATPCLPSTRRTSGSSRAATSTTPRCGFSTPPLRWRTIEVLERRACSPTAKSLPQALKLNPAFFKIVYTDLLNAKKTRKAVQAALAPSMTTWPQRAPVIFGPVLEHLREVGEARSATEIEALLPAQLRHRRRHRRVRVPGRPGPDRQGAAARPAHQEQQRRRGGAGVLLRRRSLPDDW